VSYRILLVEPDGAPVVGAGRALVDAGHRVAWLETFADASRFVAAEAPDLVVTALRLGAFNGVHLMLRLRTTSDTPVVIVGDPSDFTEDIARHGGRFVPTPIDPATLQTVVAELLAGRPPKDPTGARTWSRRRTVLAATVENTSASVIELSYGGLRLQLPGAPAERAAPIEIRLPSLGLSLQAIMRWSKPAEEGTWVCGAELAPAASGARRKWRWIVDSIN
jgi:DNA-binding response OmpR family regulator